MLPLIAIKSLVTLNIAINLCYFHVWHTIFSIYVLFQFWHTMFFDYALHIPFDQLRFYPCSSTTFRVHKFIISQFHPEQQLHKNILQLYLVHICAPTITCIIHSLGMGCYKYNPYIFTKYILKPQSDILHMCGFKCGSAVCT